MAITIHKIRFDYSGYYFLGLIVLVFLGFWPSYFSKFLHANVGFTLYFHFHALMLSLWLCALVVQPILIRKKKLRLHKAMGKVTYFLFPLVILSIILLAHSRHAVNQKNLDLRLFVPFKDVIILITAYFIAIKYRHVIDIHARGMVATGIVFIEPALARLMKNLLPGTTISYYLTILIVYSLLTVLIIRERNQKRGRWVFPLILGLYVIVHSVLVFHVHFEPWESFAKWFAAWPITQ